MLQIKNQADHYLKEKIKKAIGLMKDESGGKIMTAFATGNDRVFHIETKDIFSRS